MKKKIIRIMPFISLICFLITWLVWKHFWYGTLWFLLIPITPIILYINTKTLFKTFYPLIFFTIFIVLGCLDLWKYAWISLVIIPFFDMIFKKCFLIVRTINVIIIVIYIIIGFNFNLWHPGWIIFLLMPINKILFNDIDDKIKSRNFKKNKNVFYHINEDDKIS